MKYLSVFMGCVCSAISALASAQSLEWNAPNIRDGNCANSPAALNYPAAVINTLSSLPSGERVYLPFGNAAYYRWVYQKVNGGVAATSQSQILATKPRLRFPNLFSVLNLAVGKVYVFDGSPSAKWYELRPIPLNLFFTELIVTIVNASAGSAPDDFGGTNIPSRFVWADQSALLEWHCFDGGVQVINVISLHPTLTPAQLASLSAFLQPYGFNPQNFITITY